MDATQTTPSPTPLSDRLMVRAELLGRHTHVTAGGAAVHIYSRDQKFLARGRLDGRQYLETLGSDVRAAESRLHSLIAELDAGTYVRRGEAARRLVRRTVDLRLTFRQLIDDFLCEKRRVRGERTAANYCSRLAHVLAFAEGPANQRRWPLARDTDRQFAQALKTFLFNRRTTRNGRAGAPAKMMSARQVHNVLDCLRSVFHWAVDPAVGKLPAGFTNPMTADVVGQPPTKDPFRPAKLPTDQLPGLIAAMDAWQLCHLGLLSLLPCRPDEFAGLLLGDVDFDRKVLSFGTRLGGSDFTKARHSFTVPFPSEAEPLLRALVGGRHDGPLLRNRAEFGRPRRSALPVPGALATGYDTYLAARLGDAVQTEQDRKQAFRRYLATLGGVTTNRLAREFKKLARAVPGGAKATLYDLRHTVTQAMKDSGMPHLDLRYLTSHAVDDIINTYTTPAIFESMAKYFGTIPMVLAAVSGRARELGLVVGEPVASLSSAGAGD